MGLYSLLFAGELFRAPHSLGPGIVPHTDIASSTILSKYFPERYGTSCMSDGYDATRRMLSRITTLVYCH